jgi:hypothetical protein
LPANPAWLDAGRACGDTGAFDYRYAGAFSKEVPSDREADHARTDDDYISALM